jgi:hypothetical protein
MGIPSFIRIHNQRKAQVLFVFQRYNQSAPGGHGLLPSELAELLNWPVEKIYCACQRLGRWKYITFTLSPKRKRCIYKISAKGSLWLNKWSFLIPWERYGWTEETIADIDRKIKEIVEFRGYK